MHTRQTPPAAALQQSEYTADLRQRTSSLEHRLAGKRQGRAAARSSAVATNTEYSLNVEDE